MGFTETNVLSDLVFLNSTLPLAFANIEWSLPIPTCSPGKIFAKDGAILSEAKKVEKKETKKIKEEKSKI